MLFTVLIFYEAFTLRNCTATTVEKNIILYLKKQFICMSSSELNLADTDAAPKIYAPQNT